MQHFPIFMDLAGRRVVLSGGGDAALAKLRLLLKTEARLTVLAADPAPEIAGWAAEGRLRLVRRTDDRLLRADDPRGSLGRLLATEEALLDERRAQLLDLRQAISVFEADYRRGLQLTGPRLPAVCDVRFVGEGAPEVEVRVGVRWRWRWRSGHEVTVTDRSRSVAGSRLTVARSPLASGRPLHERI